MIISGEEIVFESTDAGEMEEGTAAVADVVGERGGGGGGVMGSEMEAGEEGFERGVAVDEGGEEVRAVLDERAEGEEEEREEEECVEIGGESDGCLFQELARATEVAQP